MVKRKGVSRRPLLAETSSRREKLSGTTDPDLPFDIDDEVGQHVRDRHRQLGFKAGISARLPNSQGGKPALDFGDELGQDDADAQDVEPELYERDVLPVDISESDDDDDEGDSDRNEDGDESEDSDGRSPSAGDKLEQRDWGSRRRVWYGADNADYEVMPEEERDAALAEEEEEAIALQKQAVNTLLPQDFIDDDLAQASSDDGDDGDDVKVNGKQQQAPDDGKKAKTGEQPGVGDDNKAIPEIPILIKEAAACESELETLRPSVESDQRSATLFHLYALFLQNVACLLVIQSDPAAAHIDVRKHPIIARVASIRSLITKVRQSSSTPSPGQHNSRKQLRAKQNGNGQDPPARKPNIERVSAVAKESPDDGDDDDFSDEDSIEQAARPVRSQKDKPKRNRSNSDAGAIVVVDDEQANALVGNVLNEGDINASNDVSDAQKRRKLNRLVGEMERDRYNKLARRSASGDADAPRDSRRMKSAVANAPPGPQSKAEGSNNMSDDDTPKLDDILGNEGEHDGGAMTAMEKRKEPKARKKAEAPKPHVYTFNDSIEPDSKRKASRNIVANRGLTRYRPRSKKTPRTRNRLAYETAIKKRRSVVRDFQGSSGISYSGEATGINMAARKGSNLSLF